MTQKEQKIKDLYKEDADVRRFFGNPEGKQIDMHAQTLAKISDALCDVGAKQVYEQVSDDMDHKLANLATKDDLEDIAKEVKTVKLARKEDRQLIEKHESQLSEMRHQGTDNAIKLNHVEKYTQQIPDIHRSINALHETVNVALQLKSAQPQYKAPGFLSKIPWPAWAALGAGVATAIVYILTGDIVNFSSIGGAK